MSDPSVQLLDAAKAGVLEDVQKLLQEGADPAYQDESGLSPLMAAAECGSTAVMMELLNAGAPWNAQDKEGYCAGEYASGGKQAAAVELLLQWGVQSELLLGAAQRHLTGDKPPTSKPSNSQYLESKLVYKDNKLLDADGEAVMMGWEAPLMQRHAQVICQQGGDVLNVGFGLGIIDTFIQGHSPASHTIIEAHPDVYRHMLEQGWDKKPGVKILFGRWQDVMDQLDRYDGIFFDTYGEYYEELREFHKALPRLLKPTGVYSYFNGLASDNIFFHTVYNRLIQLELQTCRVGIQFHMVRVDPGNDEEWKDVRTKYWHFDTYFLPVCALLPAQQGLEEEEDKDELEEEEQGQEVADGQQPSGAGQA